MKPFKLIFSIGVLLFFVNVNSGVAQCNHNPSITGTNSTICEGQSVQFGISGFNNSYNYSWYFDNVQEGTGQSHTKIFNSSGNIEVKLRYDSSGVCLDSTITNIVVNPTPNPTFTMNNNNQCSPVNTVFTNNTSGNNITYSWKENGTEFSTNTNAAKNYALVGNGTASFDIRLVATSNLGCVDSVQQVFSVKRQPEALMQDTTFNGAPFIRCNSASSVVIGVEDLSNTNNSSYFINWGDGNTYSGATLPYGTSNTYTNFFGYDTITLTVTGINTCQSTSTYQIFNGGLPQNGLSYNSTATYCVPYTVTFPIDTSITNQNTSGTTYLFEFDDGSPDVALNHPIDNKYLHTFNQSSCGATPQFIVQNAPNAFSVSLTATNACGDSYDPVGPIRLSSKPSANFSYTPIACEGSTLQFTNTSDSAFINNGVLGCNTNMTRLWSIMPASGANIVGSSASNTMNATFSASGLYDVQLIVGNNCGNDTIVKQVCIVPIPLASFDINTNTQSDTIGCVPFIVDGISNTSNTVTGSCFESYQWNIATVTDSCSSTNTIKWEFIGGTSATSEVPQIRFLEPGEYTLELLIDNICSGTSSFTRTITVQDKPNIVLGTIPSACEQEEFTPSLQTFNNCYTPSTSFSWSATNGTIQFPSQQTPGTVSFNNSGTQTIQVVATNVCGTDSVSTPVTIKTLPIPPTLIANAPCENDTIIITTDATGATPNITYSWNFPDNNSSYSFTDITRIGATTNMQGDYILTVTDQQACSDTVSVFVPVDTLPIVSILASDTNPCVLDNINLTASGADSYTWQLQGGNSTSNPLSLNPTTDSTYRVIGTDGNGCKNTANIFIDTKPLPEPNAGLDTIVCTQNPAIQVQLIGNPNDGTWSAIGNIGNNTITSDGWFTPNDTTINNIELIYTYTDSITTCVNTDTLEVQVILPDVADAGSDSSVCVGDAIIYLEGNYNNTGTWREVGSSAEITTFDPTTAGTFKFVYTIGVESCITHDTMTITVDTLPNVNIAASDLTPCAGDSVSLVPSNATTYLWLFNNGNVSLDTLFVNPTQSTTYTVVGTDNNGCKNSETITINPVALPIVDVGNDTSACYQNPPIDMQLMANISGGIWSAVGDISPNSIDSTGTFTPNDTATNNILVYTYTEMSTGCTNTDTLKIDVIEPTAAADVGNDTTFCEGDPMITFSNLGTSNGGTWRNLATNAEVTTFNPNIAGTYSFSLTLGAGSCETKDTLQIIVHSLPTVTAHSDFSICRNAADLNLMESPANGVWTGSNGITDATNGIFNPSLVTASSTTLTYTFTDNNGCVNDDNVNVTIHDVTEAFAGIDTTICNITDDILLPNFSPTTNGTGTWSGNGMQNNNQGIFNSNGVSGTYEVYYSFENNNNCIDTDTLEITVNELIKPVLQNDTAVCINTSDLTLTVSEPNGIWTQDGQSFTNPFTTNQSGIFEIIYEIESGTTCESSDTLEIRVEDLPQITITQDTSVCADSAPIDLFESPLGGTWTGTGITNNTTGIFNVSNGTQTVTYTYTQSQVFYGNTLQCVNSDSLTITVDTLPIIDIPDTIVYCLVTYNVTLPTGIPNNGTWTGTGITGTDDFHPTNAGGIGDYTATYTFVDDNGCESSDNMHIRVEAADSVSAGFNDTICITEQAALLTGFYPTSGGFWSGNGIDSSGFFNPVQAGAGLHTLIYTYGNGTCEVSVSKTRLVVDTTIINAGMDDTYCLNGGLDTLVGVPIGGVWSGNGVTNDSIFSPPGEGMFSLKYTFTEPINGCISEDYRIITIDSLPDVDAGLDTTLCSANDTIQLPNGIADVVGTGVWSGSNAIIDNINLSVNPSIIGANNTAILYYTFEDNNTCRVTDSIELDIISPVAIEAGQRDTVCYNDGLDTLVGFPIGGKWSGTDILNDSIFENINNNTPPTVYTLTYTYDDGTGGCVVSDTRERVVRDLPTVNAGDDEIRCLNEPPFQLIGFSPAGGIWTGQHTDQNGIFTPTDTGTFTLTYTYIDFFGCENFDTKTITINPLPIPDAGLDTTLCSVNDTIPLNNGISNVIGSGIWTGSNGIIDSTDVSFSVNPSIIGANNTVTLYFTYTDTFTCSVTDSMELDIISPVAIDAGLSDTVCYNDGLDTLVGFPVGGIWTGTGILNDSVFENRNGTTPPNIYTLTYTYDDGNGGCLVTDSRERTVRALPIVNAGLDTLVCIETPAFEMFGYSPITDFLGTGIWTGNGITDENLGIFESDTAGIGQDTLTYTFTDFFGCVDSNTRIIDVVDLPRIDSLVGLDTLCNQPFGVQYVGYQNSGNPNDGIWSGQNMAIDGTFTPNGVGDFTVYYCYTDNNTCERCDSIVITVISPEPVEAGIADTICIDEGIHTLTAEFPNGGFWSGSMAILDSIVGTFDPLVATGGWHTVTYIYGEGTCFVSDTTGVYVRDLAFVDAGQDEEACDTDADFAISGFSPTGGVWSGTGVTNNSGIFSPNNVTPGTYPITYFYTDSITGCDTSRVKNVTIHPLSEPDFTFDTTLCINVPYTIMDLSTNTTQWLWDFGDGTTYTVANPTHTYTTTGNYTIKLIATSVHGCKDSTTLNVFVTEIPTASFVKDTIDGCTPLPVNFTNTSVGDLMMYSWNLGNSSPLVTALNPPTTVYEDGTQDTTYYITLTTSNLCGADVFTDSILVYPKPQIVFAPDVNSGCTPLVVDFVNNTLGNPDDFYWNYGNGNSDTLTTSATHSHTFYTDTVPSVYTITLIAENECGFDTANTSITVHPVTVESFFNADTSIGCQPFTVDFTNYSTQGTTIIWDFGDGTTDTTGSTTHTFTQAGTFKVVQYVTNGCGYDSTFTWITVLPAPTANFTSQNSVCEESPITFTNTTANTTGQLWDFGDGNTSTDSVATHIYTTAGTYQVTLTAFNNTSQCPGTFTQTVTVLPKPIAIFNASDTTGCEDLAVQFTDASIGNITGYNYNFGDMNGSVNPSPLHTYLDSGVYTVKYVVVDANTCVSDTVSNDIVVYPIPTSNFAFAILDSCEMPADVQFTNLSQGAVGYEWTVDNSGNFLTTNNPMVTYNNDGIYNINLTAINIYGCRDSIQQTFELFAPPVAAWTVDQPNSCLPSEVFYTNNSTGTGLNHFYNFGDSSTSTLPSPTHIFNAVGTYVSTYYVIDINGCVSDTLDETIEVFPVPTSDFAFEILDSCTVPTLVSFTNQSQGATNYIWRLDNGQILGNVSPTTYYNQAGTYTVELVAENSFSCRDSSQQTFEIYTPPRGFVTYEQLDTCEPSLVQFYPNALNTTDYFWNFGNGQTSTVSEPIATYQNVGIYNVELILGVNNNCFDTLTYNDFVQVYPRPFANFVHSDTMIDGRFKGVVKFYNHSIGANQYAWDFGDNATSNLEHPLHAFQSNGLFDVELIATNTYNCSDDTIIGVRPDFFGTLEVPNIMAPNFGIGEDRFFIPKGIGLETYLVEVFDKQGTRVWFSEAIDNDGRPSEQWDGKFQGEDLPQGAYVWKVKAQFINGTTVHRTGTVTIVR